MKRFIVASAMAVSLAAMTAASAQDIKIAVNGPLTGGEATFGKQMVDGAELAVADINAKGGLLGRKLVLVKGDDACDPKQAVSVANKTVQDKVVFVAGHYCSSSSIPASKIYAEEGIIQITPASTNPKLTDERAGPNVFRVVGRDDQQGEIAGGYLARAFKGKKVAIVHDKSTYGKGLADETKKYMNKAGLQEAMYEAITKGDKDFTALVTKMKAANIDLVYLGGYHGEAGLLVRQMRDQGMKAGFMSGDALVTQEFWQITGPAGAGTLMTFAPDPRKNPAAADVVKKFRDKKIEPEGYVIYTYAAIQTWAGAVQKAGALDNKKIIAALNEMEHNTVLGKFKYDKKGDPTLPPFVFYKWENGKYEQIATQ